MLAALATSPVMPEEPVTQRGPQIVLAFDFGLRRLGLATGDTLTRSAHGLRALLCRDGVPDWNAVLREVNQVGAARLVVGCPYNDDGSASATAERARAFGAELQRRTQLPVHMVDERYSSLEAQELLREQRQSGQRRARLQKSDVDAMAAAIILERWFAGEGTK